MRKFRKPIAFLIVLSVLCLLLGCTPEREETQPTNTLPAPAVDSNRPATTGQTDQPPVTDAPDNSGEAADPTAGDPGTETEPSTEEEEDPDIEDTVTIIVDDNGLNQI